MRCTDCNQETDQRRFATYRARNGEERRRSICLECKNKHSTEYQRIHNERLKEYRTRYNKANRTRKQDRDAALRAEIKRYVNAAKDVPCMDCGRKWPPVAMDFDHVRGNKIKSIASFVSGAYKLDLIKEEIAKCEIVCACCHRVRTWKTGANFSPIPVLKNESHLMEDRPTSPRRERIKSLNAMEVKILAKLDASPNKSFDAKDLLDQSEISKHSVPQVAGVLLSLHATKQILRVRRGRYQSVHRTDDTESTKIRMPKSQIELLRSFLSTDNKWVRPVDIGGTARSQHSVNLNKLHQKGFVDKQRRNQTAVSFLYAITDAGKDAISTLTSQYQ